MGNLTSNNLQMLERSMNFLWTKQTALLDNISNVETPNYKAKTVTFEETFQQKLEAAQRRNRPRAAARDAIQKAEWKVDEAQESTRLDGNSVNITEQSVELVRTAFQLQYAMQAINGDLNTLRTAIKG